MKLTSIISWLLIVLVPLSAWPQLEPPPASQQISRPEEAVQTSEQEKRTTRIRKEVAKRGVGEKARVRVKLRDGLELKGYITRVEQDSFEIQTDLDKLDPGPAKDRLVTVAYADVVKIRGPQSRMARIGTDVGLTIVVVAVLAGLGLLALWDYNRRHRY